MVALNAKAFCSGEIALRMAVAKGHVHIVEKLVALMSKEDLEILDGSSTTALSRASALGDIQLLECMHQKNKNLLTNSQAEAARGGGGLTMEHSGRSITNVGGQTEQPAWANAFLVELKDNIRTIVRPTHLLCIELQCCLTGLETKLALTNKVLTKELNIMRMELFSVRQQLFELSQSVHTVLIQLQTLVRRVDNMEEHLAHVRDTLGQDLYEPARDLD
ncbi:hypothetical protein CJ030_MR8G022845 [Morella rubra]|uniref:Uncharacterized protein n=1 Tax=Morella rubra TaxID=262757 RepID=A0A6A1URZ7_9ROSI|nr:hypothetical protein CJ030_MR8G022845 [Morella rubra]